MVKTLKEQSFQIYKSLKVFLNHRIYIEKMDEVSFVYENFQVDIDSYENVVVLWDGNNDTCRLYIVVNNIYDNDIIVCNNNDLKNMMIELGGWMLSCDE